MRAYVNLWATTAERSISRLESKTALIDQIGKLNDTQKENYQYRLAQGPIAWRRSPTMSRSRNSLSQS